MYTKDVKLKIQSTIIASVCFISTQVFAVSYSDSAKKDEVIIENKTDVTLPYKQRRGQYGGLFSVNYESFKPINYFSLIKSTDYEGISENKGIPLLGLEIGFKYNFSYGSVSALAGYSSGSISNETKNLEELTAHITKFAMNLALDGIGNEPYIVPFAQLGIHSISWTEVSRIGPTTKEENFNTKYNLSYKIGLGFQLNWIEKSIDPNSNEEALRSSGLENTYLDVFYSAYSKPSQVADAVGVEGEPDLESNQFGAGLKLEF